MVIEEGSREEKGRRKRLDKEVRSKGRTHIAHDAEGKRERGVEGVRVIH